ncbi:MAG TPA: SRPBCC domain-containing protein [Burkholderiaceae bacterium]
MREVDFRVGSDELLQGRLANGMETRFDARYCEIVENERIAYSYVMHLPGRRHSSSVAKVELFPEAGGAKFIFAEQAAFFDGTDAEHSTAMRKHDTGSHLDRIPQYL